MIPYLEYIIADMTNTAGLYSYVSEAGVFCAALPKKKGGGRVSGWKEVRPMPPLSKEERRVVLEAGTEPPGSGKYVDFWKEGVYLCRQCGLPLYRSSDKFTCSCGWPAFDENLPEAVLRRMDPDGRRTEIVCSNCAGHLGHVFEGERLTPKNTRHCVNSLSLAFVPTRSALFAGGCFWGIEDRFASTRGVVTATSGYTGGLVAAPTYRQVCGGDTGHAEAVRLDFEPSVVSYEALVELFFKMHDPTQLDRQGPDFGSQHRTAIFYFDEEQRKIAQKAIDRLKASGVKVVTELKPAGAFYPAEDYHQKYLRKQGK